MSDTNVRSAKDSLLPFLLPTGDNLPSCTHVRPRRRYILDPTPHLVGAETQYRKALASDSIYGHAYNNLGLISTRRNRIAEAIGHFNQGIKVDPTYLDNYLNIATALLETGRPQAAVGILHQGALSEAGRIDESLAAIRRCLELNPSNDDARNAIRQLQDIAPTP